MAVVNDIFRKVWEPLVTGIPEMTPHIDMMMLPDGEIRHYGLRAYAPNDWIFVCQKSFDYGMSWSLEQVENITPGATIRSPWSGDYITIRRNFGVTGMMLCACEESYQSIMPECGSPGMFLFRSSNGPDGPFTIKKLYDDIFHVQRQPLPLRSRRRWILPAEKREGLDGPVYPFVLYSDDDGETWNRVDLPLTPCHKPGYPHKGARWLYCGAEPVIVEYDDGSLCMLLRTSTDYHYWCFSYDGGETWSEMTPSPFYSFATMPLLYALSGGRTLAVWNNSTPLPELDHALQPNIPEHNKNGVWEDVFTNRDVLHAAISDDMGKTWRGFREIALNERRNDVDYRVAGDTYTNIDRSVHQSQVLELPENKILIAYGQNTRCQRFAVFDIGFLLEKGRSEDFRHGLCNWSVHQYYKSHSGGLLAAGHCTWNRRAGATLVPAPDGTTREMLQIARHPDSRLFSEKEGAVWNFPASRRGRITLSLILTPGSDGMRISLADRWFNPIDPVIAEFTPFSLELDAVGRVDCTPMLEVGKEITLVIEYDQDAGRVNYFCGENQGSSKMLCRVSGTISYLHLQTLSQGSDPFGVLISSVKMEQM